MTTSTNIIGNMIAADARRYDRARDLPRIVSLFQHEMTDYSIAGIRHIIDVLERRHAGQRALAERGHWSYDCNQHIAILAALKAERCALIDAMFATMQAAA
jgi:hypothetical protein